MLLTNYNITQVKRVGQYESNKYFITTILVMKHNAEFHNLSTFYNIVVVLTLIQYQLTRIDNLLPAHISQVHAIFDKVRKTRDFDQICYVSIGFIFNFPVYGFMCFVIQYFFSYILMMKVMEMCISVQVSFTVQRVTNMRSMTKIFR